MLHSLWESIALESFSVAELVKLFRNSPDLCHHSVVHQQVESSVTYLIYAGSHELT